VIVLGCDTLHAPKVYIQISFVALDELRVGAGFSCVVPHSIAPPKRRTQSRHRAISARPWSFWGSIQEEETWRAPRPRISLPSRAAPDSHRAHRPPARYRQCRHCRDVRLRDSSSRKRTKREDDRCSRSHQVLPAQRVKEEAPRKRMCTSLPESGRLLGQMLSRDSRAVVEEFRIRWPWRSCR
jgi:hypothetical protein